MSPTAKLVQIEAWSYSRFSTYETCPAKAKFSYIDKIKEPDSTAGLNGTRVHAIADVWVSGALPKPDRDNVALMPELRKIVLAKKIPAELARFEAEFKRLQQMKAVTGRDWAFDRDWNPTDWFGPRAWLRIKVDTHFLDVKKVKAIRTTRVEIVDYKTGKERSEHKDQRSLYALGAFLVYPDAVEVRASHWYLDAGVERPEKWKASELPKLKKLWLNKTEAMRNDTTFAPRPGDYCRWCFFSKEKKGPCPF